MAVLVAPTEPPTIKTLGRVSSLPEKRGVDVLWIVRGKWCGVQRKEISDLIASLGDGRLQREVAQMQHLDYRMLVVEGRLEWTMDGMLVGRGYGQPWTKKAHMGVLWSLQESGIWVGASADQHGTVELVQGFQGWTTKARHNALRRRPNATGAWGRATSKDFGMHLLMGIDGVGPEMAEAIWNHFGGIPWGWMVTKEELMEVKGVGEKKAEKMLGALEWQSAPVVAPHIL